MHVALPNFDCAVSCEWIASIVAGAVLSTCTIHSLSLFGDRLGYVKAGSTLSLGLCVSVVVLVFLLLFSFVSKVV